MNDFILCLEFVSFGFIIFSTIITIGERHKIKEINKTRTPPYYALSSLSSNPWFLLYWIMNSMFVKVKKFDPKDLFRLFPKNSRKEEGVCALFYVYNNDRTKKVWKVGMVINKGHNSDLINNHLPHNSIQFWPEIKKEINNGGNFFLRNEDLTTMKNIISWKPFDINRWRWKTFFLW